MKTVVKLVVAVVICAGMLACPKDEPKPVDPTPTPTQTEVPVPTQTESPQGNAAPTQPVGE